MSDIESASQSAGGGRPTEPPILELRAVHKAYRRDQNLDWHSLWPWRRAVGQPRPALGGVSCRFYAGQCTALLGHNGAGKTTAIRLALGLVRPSAGEVLFQGRPLRTLDKLVIGYMPEVNKLAQGLTVEETLAHQLRLQGRQEKDRAALIAAKLHEVGLSAHAGRRIAKLSKGMARRLAWAQATIHKPRLLILDEPASGLDPLGRDMLLTWIAAEKVRGVAILLCTHELAQVAALCDAFYILQRGRLVLGQQHPVAGSRLSLQYQPRQTRYRIDVSGIVVAGTSPTVIVGQFAQRHRLAPPLSVEAHGLAVALRFADYGVASAWLTSLLAAGLIITRFGGDDWMGGADLQTYFSGEEA